MSSKTTSRTKGVSNAIIQLSGLVLVQLSQFSVHKHRSRSRSRSRRGCGHFFLEKTLHTRHLYETKTQPFSNQSTFLIWTWTHTVYNSPPTSSLSVSKSSFIHVKAASQHNFYLIPFVCSFHFSFWQFLLWTERFLSFRHKHFLHLIFTYAEYFQLRLRFLCDIKCFLDSGLPACVFSVLRVSLERLSRLVQHFILFSPGSRQGCCRLTHSLPEHFSSAAAALIVSGKLIPFGRKFLFLVCAVPAATVAPFMMTHWKLKQWLVGETGFSWDICVCVG